MNDQVVADALKYTSRLAHTEEGWIEPLYDAIKGVDPDEARWKPAPDVPSIWELLAHAIPYTDGLLCDLTGLSKPDEDDWPAVVDTTDEVWYEFQSKALSAVRGLQEAIDRLTPGELASPPPGKKRPRASRIADIAIHDAYHAGQIIKLQQTYRAAKRTVAGSAIGA